MKHSIFKNIVSIILVVSLLFSFSTCFIVHAESQLGEITHTNVNVRSGPTTTENNKIGIQLTSGDEVTILGEVNSDGDTQYKTWYHIEFKYNGETKQGYVYTGFVKLIETTDDFVMPEGVPEEYKEYIENLLSRHPNWKFIFQDTGYDWNDLFSTTENGQCYPGRSLLQNSYLSYRSTASGNYNWREDKWIAHDGKTWFQANEQVIAYYMDPRNFLNDKNIFMFENLSYDSNTHTIEGIENIINGSFMDGVNIKNLDNEDISYQQAYIDAAIYSNVSPFHLASRTIQEVGKSGSGSTSGNYSAAYKGYYNFYNIGATAGNDPVANGLSFAKSDTYSNGNKKPEEWRLPWDTQYKSITGGAYWIGSSYINSKHKQNTLYYQKFNTSNPDSDFFYHQYMSNIAAPSSESPEIRASYVNLGVIDNSFTFVIPYYRNMPKDACKLPNANDLNPNNWLKTLSIGDYNINFDGGTTSYNLTVPATVNSVKITATTVNANAKITGIGNVTLKDGKNIFNIVVTAENGDKRTYTVNITRTTEGAIPLKSISLNKTDVSLYVGDTTTLSVNYNPSTTTDNKTITWSSSNNKVATVDKSGKITAIGKGTATITAKVGSFAVSCKVTVLSKDNIKIGDVDADDEVTIADALMIFKYKSGEIKLSNTALKAADTDKNDKVELADALRIFKYKSGEIDKL